MLSDGPPNLRQREMPPTRWRWHGRYRDRVKAWAVDGVELPFGDEPASWSIDGSEAPHDRPIADADLLPGECRLARPAAVVASGIRLR